MIFDKLEEFKKNLRTITKGKSSYYQYRVKTPFFTKTYHVGKYDPKRIPEYYTKILSKITKDIIKEIGQREYISTELTKDDFIILDNIRFIFYIGLSHFSDSEIEKYNEIEFTKYVHGTTSIEGNTYSLRDTDITLNENRTVGGKTVREFYEVRNYASLREEMEVSPKITLDLIKTIHRYILENIDDESKGIFRNIMVGIRGSNLTPLPPNVIEDELQELIDEYKDDLENFHPIESISRFHQRFEEIHPFKDGNGRVGRELLRIQLGMHGYPFFYIGDEQRDEYLRALDMGNEGEYSVLLRFIIKNIFREFGDHIKKMDEEIINFLESDELASFKGLLTSESAENLKELFQNLLSSFELEEEL